MSTAATATTMRMKNDIDDAATTTKLLSRVHLPLLTRDGTLLLQCPQPNNENHDTTANNATTIPIPTNNVHIIPSMSREDVLIEIFSISPVVKNDDDDKSVLFSEVGVDNTIECTNLVETTITPYLHVKNLPNGKQTSDGRLGSYAEVDILSSPTSTAIASTDRVIVITTPEKFNITCQIHAGDISIERGNKMEGDVHLLTNYGNIDIGCKVRGYEVTLNTMTDDTSSSTETTTNDEMTHDKGNIYVRKVIEAKTLDIRSSSRVRARMLNVGSKLSIVATTATSDAAMSSLADIHTYTKLDDDDEGAVIDIGSIYIVTSGLGMDENDARLIVNGNSNHHHNRGLVRVKSSHGHIVIHAKTNLLNYYTPPITTSELSNSTMTPLIDLGGVNGSCDVLLEGISLLISSSSSILDAVNTKHDIGLSSATPTMRIHFDALSPESISTITSRGILMTSSDTDDDVIPSSTSITMDRKLETEIRLLSAVSRPSWSEIIDYVVDAHDIASEDVQDVNTTLLKIAKEKAVPLFLGDSKQEEQPLISIETDAYIDGEYASLDGGFEQTLEYHHCGMVQYMQGTMSNRSGEPDARSDMRGKGKINIDGASLQALQGFQSGKKQSPSSVLLPLLAVATDGGIKLETLSWFGSIARRYGLKATEADSKKDELLGSLGRQARRVPRLEK